MFSIRGAVHLDFEHVLPATGYEKILIHFSKVLKSETEACTAEEFFCIV